MRWIGPQKPPDPAWRKLLIPGIAALIAFGIFGAFLLSIARRPQPPRPQSIVYVVEGGARAVDLTFKTSYATEYERITALPWQSEPQRLYPGDYAVVTAAKVGGDGTVTCRVLRDGGEWSTETCDAPNCVATCGGPLP
jgi:hypothetical protein